MSDLVVRRVRVFEFVVRKPRQELIQFPLWKGFYLLRDVFFARWLSQCLHYAI